MSLYCPPWLPEAEGLVKDMIDIITKSEKRQRAGKADELPVLKSTAGLIIGSLLIGFQTGGQVCHTSQGQLHHF